MEGYTMKKDKLTDKEFSCLICFPILSLFSGIGTYNIIKSAKTDAYISVLISYLIGFIILGLFIYIMNYRKDLNINLKIKYLFGKYLGFIINCLINILIFIIGGVLLYNISNFAISQFLSETPLLIFMLLLGIILIYNVSLGIENISRVSVIFLGIICLLTIISTAGILPSFELSNLKPFLENGIEKPFKSGISLTLTNVIPIFTLLIIPKDKISDQKLNKHLILFYSFACFFTFLAILLTLGALGIYLSELYQYPEYTVLKKISLFNFIDRIENFIYIKWILSSVISLSLIIYYISSSVKEKSKKIVPAITTTIMIATCLLIFKNNTIFYNFSYYIFPYLNLLLLIIFIIVGINIFIRKRLLKEK